MTIQAAKLKLDSLIAKSRVHLYKPIQIAEILYRDRLYGDVNLELVETYRIRSRKWRDIISDRFLGTSSTSSSRYQDDLFNENAIPPNVLSVLGDENKKKNGIVEAYIYDKFKKKYMQLSKALHYCRNSKKESFDLGAFLDLFWQEPGLRRSIDKVYEIVVYALFTVLVEILEVELTVSINQKSKDILKEFEDFTKMILGLDLEKTSYQALAKIHRVGVTNAADRGLDMYANFGLAIQIKHLSLSEELAENVVGSITADRIVIVCKDSEYRLIVSLLTQIGWRARIQSIVTESHLKEWYEKALRGTYSDITGDKLLDLITTEIKTEFPSSDDTDFQKFYNEERNYNDLSKDVLWSA